MNIWWIRRDLRLADNTALQRALADGRGVIPLFIIDPHNLRFPAAKRQAFLIAGLRDLDRALRARGSRLVVRQGAPAEVLAALHRQVGVDAVCAEECYDPCMRRRDAEVAATWNLRLTRGLTVHHPADLHKQDGRPYTVYTPFMRFWRSLPLPSAGELLPAPAQLPAVPDSLTSDELPDVN